MQTRKLTPGEITRAVEKIRKRYDDYIYKYFKSRSLRSAFEDRYLEAIKTGKDISSFLLAEISAVEELIQREESRVAFDSMQNAQKKESFSDKVDRVIEEQKERIRKHSPVTFHRDAEEELRHLVGAVSEFADKYWESLLDLLKETAYSRNSLTMMNLEDKLRTLASSGANAAPSGLSRYLYHINRFPRNHQALDRESKQYILDAAFWLHDVKGILDRVLENYPQLIAKTREDCQAVRGVVDGVIEDFRLQDFKRKR